MTDFDDPPECSRCHATLRLADENEWPDDGMSLFCWECQHAEIKDLVMLVRRGMRACMSNDIAPKLVSQTQGFLERHGYRTSFLRKPR